ncbi:hypothetical protein E3U43_012178, partial [Larimichthys crocea]
MAQPQEAARRRWSRHETKVNIGVAYGRWRQLMRDKGFQSHAEVACFLLYSYERRHSAAPCHSAASAGTDSDFIAEVTEIIDFEQSLDDGCLAEEDVDENVFNDPVNSVLDLACDGSPHCHQKDGAEDDDSDDENLPSICIRTGGALQRAPSIDRLPVIGIDETVHDQPAYEDPPDEPRPPSQDAALPGPQQVLSEETLIGAKASIVYEDCLRQLASFLVLPVEKCSGGVKTGETCDCVAPFEINIAYKGTATSVEWLFGTKTCVFFCNYSFRRLYRKYGRTYSMYSLKSEKSYGYISELQARIVKKRISGAVKTEAKGLGLMPRMHAQTQLRRDLGLTASCPQMDDHTYCSAQEQAAEPDPPSLKRRKLQEVKRNRDRRRQKTRVNIGVAFSRWKSLMREKCFQNDSEVACFLLHSYEKGNLFPAAARRVPTIGDLSGSDSDEHVTAEAAEAPIIEQSLHDTSRVKDMADSVIDWAEDGSPLYQPKDGAEDNDSSDDENLPSICIRTGGALQRAPSIDRLPVIGIDETVHDQPAYEDPPDEPRPPSQDAALPGPQQVLSEETLIGAKASIVYEDCLRQLASFLVLPVEKCSGGMKTGETCDCVAPFEINIAYKGTATSVEWAAKKKGQSILLTWLKDIVNHFWWCCKTADTTQQFL